MLRPSGERRRHHAALELGASVSRRLQQMMRERHIMHGAPWRAQGATWRAHGARWGRDTTRRRASQQKSCFARSPELVFCAQNAEQLSRVRKVNFAARIGECVRDACFAAAGRS